MTITRRHAYKEIRLQQLRSICATAQLGSLAAAAKSLGLSQPAVWEQVRALEREFGAVFVEAHGRGCRLTEAGKLLVELAEPVVAAADSIKRTFQERRGEVVARLTIAATQRILIEDLCAVIPHFIAKHPQVHLRFLERLTGQVSQSVESGEADLGVASAREPSGPRLRTEPAYELDTLLITRHDHPLASKATIKVRDLVEYPFVNAEDSFSRPEVAKQLTDLGAFRVEPRTIEAATTHAVRHFVQLGLGIGLVLGRLPQGGNPALHERNLSRHFGRAGINLVWRKGALPTATACDFADTVRAFLGEGK